MQTKIIGVLALALAAVVASPLGAQQLPPVRQLGPVAHVATEPLGAISAVRQLPDGRLIVNDILGRRVVMFDSTLKLVTVIADTTSATANAYGSAPGGLIAYRGDSTLFVDPASLSMLVIDSNGKVGRVMSVPRPNDARFLIGGPFGSPGFDPAGRLVYRAPPRFTMPAPPAPGKLPTIDQPDSAALIRVDLATRKVDTATFFKIPKVNLNISQAPDGGIRVVSSINPLPQTDDWAILPDGTIALVRKDFHVDWLAPNGTVTSSPKVPYQWERLSDEAKVAYIDSVKTAFEKARASGQFAFGAIGPMRVGTDAARDGAPGARPSPNPGPGGAGVATTTTTTANGNTTVTAVGPGGAGNLNFTPNFVAPTELPDYKPAFGPGSTRADLDGNLWVRTTQNLDGRPVYDVLNRKGELIDRVQLPQNRALAGFGAGGLVYLAVRDGTTAHLEVARVK